jgi:TetR/AcrR family transcriptional regulator, cholesterol catabolism regulator
MKSIKKSTKSSKKHDSSSILDAAAKVFREKGYHHASMSDIAKQTGLLKGSLYHHISGKEELLRQIVMEGLGIYTESVQKIMTGNDQPDEMLRKAIVGFMDPIDISFNRIVVFLNERHNLPESSLKELNKRITDYEHLWIEIIERGKKLKIFRQGIDSKILSNAIFAVCQWTSRWFNPKGRYKAKELGEFYALFFLDGIKIKDSNSNGLKSNVIKKGKRRDPVTRELKSAISKPV